MKKLDVANAEIVLSKAKVKNVVAAIMVTLFFVVMILIYSVRLYSAQKDSIITRGELSAVQSAEEFDRYLITAMDCVKLTGYSVESILSKGAGHDEILDFMVKETECVQGAIDANYTGLYGYVQGEYYDGALWEPDDDYVPTERLWYVLAREKKGEITLVEPYLDAQTGAVVMTISKMLNDGESVVALDINLDMMQFITEHSSDEKNGITEMVIDNRGVVAAHSDRSMLGHSYLEEEGSVEATTIGRILSQKDCHFQINLNGTEYIVYAIGIGDHWHSVSIIDATEAFRPLKLLFAITAIIMVITVCILLYLFIMNNRKNAIAEKLTVQLSSAADIYISLCDLDIVNDSVIEIKNRNPAIAKAVAACDHNMQEIFFNIMRGLPESPTKPAAINFADMSKLDTRLGKENTTTLEYLSYGNIWVRARYIVSERDENGKITHVLWMLENIDKEKRSRDALRDMSDRAVAANEAKSTFLSNMSHEIRTPINAILGMNEMVLRECSDDTILAYSESIKTSGNTLLGIINDILDFSKIEAGKMDIIPVDYELASVLNDLVNMVQTRADSKGLLLEAKCSSNMPSILHGDEIRLKQIITNLLTNAVKYTEKGKVVFSVDYKEIEDQPEYIILCVSVRDTGIGIKPEDINKLFSEFERVEEERNRSIEGTGLGISITQRLLSLMGSTLRVKSVYGEGSVFSFELKQRVVKHDPIGEFAASLKNPGDVHKVYKAKFYAPDAQILSVDDTPINLLVFKSLLKKTGVQIDTAESGDECIEMANKKKYDIIFLDHMMPRKDGVETLREMQDTENFLNAGTPVICLTANAISGARESYIADGFSDYLTKPIDAGRLEEMIMELLPPEKLKQPADDEAVQAADTEKASAAPKNRSGVLPEFLYDIDEIDVDSGLGYCGDEEIDRKSVV